MRLRVGVIYRHWKARKLNLALVYVGAGGAVSDQVRVCVCMNLLVAQDKQNLPAAPQRANKQQNNT